MAIHPHKALKAVDERASKAGLRTIAMIEAVKGLFVLLVAVSLLHNLHKDLGEAAANLVRDLHFNPAWQYGRIFIEAADKLDDGKVWAMASAALGYSAMRIVEGYGLWNRRVWAEWFALVSGALYIPFEIYEVILRRTWLPWRTFGRPLGDGSRKPATFLPSKTNMTRIPYYEVEARL